MRKFLYSFGIATLILLNAAVVMASNEVYYTNRYDIEMTEEEYNNLLGLGFTKNQIERMDYETFIDNKDIKASVVSEVTHYYKTTTSIRNGIRFYTSEILSEEEIYEDMMLHAQNNTYSPNMSGGFYDAISDDAYKLVTTTIAYIEDDDEMRFKIDEEWLEMPTIRSYDIIGIGIEPSKVHINSSIVFRQDWTTTGDVYDYDTICAPKSQTTGGSVMYKLPTGSMRIMLSYIYFNVKKNSGVGTITSLYATGDYAHATESVTQTNVYNYYDVNHVLGIEIDTPYANSYDSIIPAEAYFLGSW